MSDHTLGRDLAMHGGLDAAGAVEQLFAAHWRELVRLSVLLMHDQDPAEGIVQDAFVAMHGRWSWSRDRDKALACLRQDVVHRSRSALRHRKVVDRHLVRGASLVSVISPPADEAGFDAARRAAVPTAMRRLPQRQREVLALRYYPELSEVEVVQILGISAGVAKSDASRGGALRSHLGDPR